MLQAIASAARSLVACVCIQEEGRKHQKQHHVLVRSEYLLAMSVDWDQLALDRYRFAHQQNNLDQFEAQLKPTRPLLSTASQQPLEEGDQVEGLDTTLKALQEAQKR